MQILGRSKSVQALVHSVLINQVEHMLASFALTNEVSMGDFLPVDCDHADREYRNHGDS